MNDPQEKSLFWLPLSLPFGVKYRRSQKTAVGSRTAQAIPARAVLYGNPHIDWPVRKRATPSGNGTRKHT